MSTSDLIVRDARPEDDAAVGDLLVAAFTVQYAAKMPQYTVGEQRQRDLRAVAHKRQQGAVLVAERGGQVVGTVTLFRPGSPDSQAWLPNAADLRHLATAPALHGQGLSRPLLDAAEARARSWGVDAICLHVRQGLVGVAALYQGRGYARTPEGDFHKPPDVVLDAFALRLR